MMKGTPIADLLKGHQIRKDDPRPILDGLKLERFPTDGEGYLIATPEQLATLLVPRQEIRDGRITGFQRDLDVRRARKVAKAIQDGTPMPTIEVALHRNAAWITDGQHRAAAGVIVRQALPTLMRKLDEAEMRALFASQAQARSVNPSTLVLSASDPLSEYIQDAVTSDDHSWAPLVTYAVQSKTRLTPNQAANIIGPYCANTLHVHGGHKFGDAFDHERAEELAPLIACFGTKETNPAAFRNVALRAITYAAICILRRHEDTPQARKRWARIMPKFPFHRYLAVNSALDMVPLLIGHWNKRLDPAKRVPSTLDD